MPKVFAYDVGTRVKVDNFLGKKEHSVVGKTGKIVELRETGTYDYTVEFDDKSAPETFLESELTKLNEYIPSVGDFVKLTHTGEKGFVETVDHEYKQVEINFGAIWQVYGWNKVELIENGENEVEEKQVGLHEHILHTFMSQYDNKDGTFTIPKEILMNLIESVYEEGC